MKTIRDRFEGVWPVPDDVTWCDSSGAYWFRVESHEPTRMAYEMNIRLDTFTRSQETTDVYVSLIEEMECELEYLLDQSSGQASESTQAIINRAKELLGR